MPSSPEPLTSAQQAHVAEYQALQAQMNDRLLSAGTAGDGKEMTAQLESLIEAADALREQVLVMPVLMDGEARARSQLLARAAGWALLLAAVTQAVLAGTGGIGGGWWITAIVTGAAALFLLVSEVAAAGHTVHRAQSRAAIAAATSLTSRK